MPIAFHDIKQVLRDGVDAESLVLQIGAFNGLGSVEARDLINKAKAEISEEASVKDAAPVWEAPVHQDIPLHELDSVAPGLDPFEENDARLADAIIETKRQFQQYQNFVLSIFQPNDVVCLMAMPHGRKPIHDFLLAEDAVRPEYYRHLQELNASHSIYLGMNAYKHALIGQRDGRKKENVSAIRTLYADADENGPAVLEKIRASKNVPEPTILETSFNKYQFIWSVEDMPQDDAEILLRTIAQEFGTDPSVAEVARVLRVPGFVNRKYLSDAPAVKLVQFNQKVWARSDFKLDSDQVQVKVPTKQTPSKDSAKYKALAEAVEWKPLIRRMNSLPDSRSHVIALNPGDVVSCPFHEHTDFTPNFGVMASNVALLHCLGKCQQDGKKSSWDLVAAVQQFDNLPNPEQAARVICEEEGLKFEDYFPPDVTFGAITATTPEVGGSALVTERADRVKTKKILWLWDQRIPLEKLSVLAGNPDQGKSLVIARVTRGLPLSMGPLRRCPSQTCWYWRRKTTRRTQSYRACKPQMRTCAAFILLRHRRRC